MDVCVPYAEIDAWIRQFGHSYGFSLEREIDRLVYNFPSLNEAPKHARWTTIVQITGSVYEDSYAHSGVTVRDNATSDEVSFLAFRMGDDFGFTFRPGVDTPAAVDYYKDIEFKSDEYGDFLKIYVSASNNTLAASSDLRANGGRFLCRTCAHSRTSHRQVRPNCC